MTTKKPRQQSVISVSSCDGDGTTTYVMCPAQHGPRTIRRPHIKMLLERFEDVQKDTTLAHKQMSAQNFVIGLVGPEGGKLSFSDGSVEIDIPPGALSKRQTIYCCRPDKIWRDDPDMDASNRLNVVFYSIALMLKAEEAKFQKKIRLKFKHFTDFQNEEQKKQLAAFVKQADCPYEKDPEADLEIDEEWILLHVNHFCNVAVGAEQQVNQPPPPLKFLATYFLAYEEFTRDVTVNLYLLIGPNDKAHMRVIRNTLIEARSTDTLLEPAHTIECCLYLEEFSRQHTSDLRLHFGNDQYIAEFAVKDYRSDEVDNAFVFRNILKREEEQALDLKEHLCHVKIEEVTRAVGTPDEISIPRCSFHIDWPSEHPAVIQPEEQVLESREQEEQQEADLTTPVQVSDDIEQFSDEFGLQIRNIEPSAVSD